jgi:hypothetical protein
MPHSFLDALWHAAGLKDSFSKVFPRMTPSRQQDRLADICNCVGTGVSNADMWLLGEALISASQKGDETTVSTLFSRYPNWITKHDMGDALMASVKEGQAEMVRFLLCSKQGPDLLPEDVGTSFLNAIENGRHGIAKIIMENAGEKLPSEALGNSLSMLIETENREIIHWILNRNNLPADDLGLFLNAMVRNGDQEMVSFCFSQHKNRLSPNELGHSLMDAIRKGHSQIAITILEQAENRIPPSFLGNAIELATSKDNRILVGALLEKAFEKIPPHMVGRAYETAAEKGFTNIYLDLHKKAATKIPPVHYGVAIMLSAKSDKPFIVNHILKHCKEHVNAFELGNALTFSSQTGNFETFQKLLDLALKRYHTDFNSFTRLFIDESLMEASNRGHVRIANILFSHSEIQIPRETIESAMIASAKNGHASILEILSPKVPFPERRTIHSIIDASNQNDVQNLESFMGAFSEKISPEGMLEIRSHASKMKNKDIRSILLKGSYAQRIRQIPYPEDLKRTMKHITDFLKISTLEQKKTILSLLANPQENIKFWNAPNPISFLTNHQKTLPMNLFFEETAKYLTLLQKNSLPIVLTEKILQEADTQVQGIPISIAVSIYKMKFHSFHKKPPENGIKETRNRSASYAAKGKGKATEVKAASARRQSPHQEPIPFS